MSRARPVRLPDGAGPFPGRARRAAQTGGNPDR